MNLGFEFYVGGLENAIINLLRDGDLSFAIPGLKELGVKDVSAYSGELDQENLLNAIKALTPRFPLCLVSYGGGLNKRKTATNLLDGDPIEEEHHCIFVIVCVSKDLRGDAARRRGAPTTVGAYTMIDAVTSLLGGVTFDADFYDDNETRREPLNHQPLLPVDVECIANRAGLAAYAVPFETSFKYQLPDRRTVFAGDVNEISLGLAGTGANGVTASGMDSPTGSGGSAAPGIPVIVPAAQTLPTANDNFGLPGVHARKGEK